jgi:hypothetical protein
VHLALLDPLRTRRALLVVRKVLGEPLGIELELLRRRAERMLSGSSANLRQPACPSQSAAVWYE